MIDCGWFRGGLSTHHQHVGIDLVHLSQEESQQGALRGGDLHLPVLPTGETHHCLQSPRHYTRPASARSKYPRMKTTFRQKNIVAENRDINSKLKNRDSYFPE